MDLTGLGSTPLPSEPDADRMETGGPAQPPAAGPSGPASQAAAAHIPEPGQGVSAPASQARPDLGWSMSGAGAAFPDQMVPAGQPQGILDALDARRGSPDQLDSLDARRMAPDLLDALDARRMAPGLADALDARRGSPDQLDSLEARRGAPDDLNAEAAQGGTPRDLDIQTKLRQNKI